MSDPSQPPALAISLDQRAALVSAVARLTREFSGRFDTATIEWFLNASYDELAPRATVTNFLPLLAERFARQRLRALAKADGSHIDTRPVALFLCAQNAGRSQMALGFFRRYAGDAAVGWSGGSAPGMVIDPNAVAAMAERGIDITDEFPKPWTDEVVRAADVVITMGCGDTCPIFPGKRYEAWEFDDPAGQNLPAVRAIRDDIERHVRRLLGELHIAARP
jgi:arsenate reductase